VEPCLSGYGEGWAPPCAVCREPLDEDGSCWFCETLTCDACGKPKPEAGFIIADGYKYCADCGVEE
jgi:hypothetical protein